MSWTFTIHAWWLVAYLGVGVALFLPLNWWAWCHKSSLGRSGEFSFWRTLWANIRREKGLPVLVQVVAWPLSIWEDIR